MEKTKRIVIFRPFYEWEWQLEEEKAKESYQEARKLCEGVAEKVIKDLPTRDREKVEKQDVKELIVNQHATMIELDCIEPVEDGFRLTPKLIEEIKERITKDLQNRIFPVQPYGLALKYVTETKSLDSRPKSYIR